MAYSVIIKPSAQKSILKLPMVIQTRILDALEELANDPRPDGVKKLQGSCDFYRIRIGDYRVIYSIQDKQLYIDVVAVGHRSSIYN